MDFYVVDIASLKLSCNQDTAKTDNYILNGDSSGLVTIVRV